MAKPLVLLIRDGWGIGEDYDGNAVKVAQTPNTDRLLAEYPHSVLQASGEAVGVRPGSQGSSEVGHLNMGAGRIVEQEVVRVDRMIHNGELFRVPRFVEAVQHCKANGSTFHLMGLVQDQGVHATQEHLFAMLEALAERGVADVCVHFFADGRDTPPQSALTFLETLEARIAACGVGRVATVCGRYWAMDRAENWERTERAYRMLLHGEGLEASSPREAIEAAYHRTKRQRTHDEDLVETDEFICPTVIVDGDGRPTGLIEPGDVVLHLNYRQDRAMQLTRAFVEDGFAEFDRGLVPDVFYMGLTRYYDEFACALVPPMNMTHLLGEILAERGLRQLRIAEFQKYRHVTSFFNGKRIEPFAGEDRIQVESITIPEDQKPEMSAHEVTEQVVTAVTDGIAAARAKAEATDKVQMESREFPDAAPAAPGDTYDLIVLNYANGDMVGHTGVFAAAVKAVETVDQCVGKVVRAVLARDGIVLVTADHGNAERMWDPATGAPITAHTLGPVEFILVANGAPDRQLIEKGKLADIAPTILQLLDIPIPEAMTAESLIR